MPLHSASGSRGRRGRPGGGGAGGRPARARGRTRRRGSGGTRRRPPGRAAAPCPSGPRTAASCSRSPPAGGSGVRLQLCPESTTWTTAGLCLGWGQGGGQSAGQGRSRGGVPKAGLLLVVVPPGLERQELQVRHPLLVAHERLPREHVREHLEHPRAITARLGGRGGGGIRCVRGMCLGSFSPLSSPGPGTRLLADLWWYSPSPCARLSGEHHLEPQGRGAPHENQGGRGGARSCGS